MHGRIRATHSHGNSQLKKRAKHELVFFWHFIKIKEYYWALFAFFSAQMIATTASPTTQTSFAEVVCRETENMIKVVIRFHRLPEQDEELKVYFTAIDDIYNKKKTFCMLYDVSAIGLLPFHVLQQQATFMRQHEVETAKYVKRCAVVVSSVAIRMAINGLFAIKKPACDVQFFTQILDAQAWLREVTIKKEEKKVN